MSYLPRMSKTYKEPPAPVLEEPEENPSLLNTLQPASSLLNEKAYNPQMALKHYKFLPHPPPVLPGPSVLEEAKENELYQEISRSRRESSKSETTQGTSKATISFEDVEASETTILIDEQTEDDPAKPLKRSHSRKTVKGSSRSSFGRKKSSKTLVDRKKDNSYKVDDVTINMCLVNSVNSRAFGTAQTDRNNQDRDKNEFFSKEEIKSLKREISAIPSVSENSEKSDSLIETASEVSTHIEKPKEVKNKSLQCTIFGSADKQFVIPPILNSLLRALAFLLHELNKEDTVICSSNERKRLMPQIQLILGDLCNQKIEQEYGFNITYSEFKRMEKIQEDLQKYIKDIYGDKEEYIDKMEDTKKVFIDLKKKILELGILNDKLQEGNSVEDFEVKEADFKHPEVTLQNKRLESEQLLAEIEFSSRELKKYQKSLAEVEWDVKILQDELSALKKSGKSKTEMLGRKPSAQKLSSPMQPRGSRSKESDDFSNMRKKT